MRRPVTKWLQMSEIYHQNWVVNIEFTLKINSTIFWSCQNEKKYGIGYNYCWDFSNWQPMLTTCFSLVQEVVSSIPIKNEIFSRTWFRSRNKSKLKTLLLANMGSDLDGRKTEKIKKDVKPNSQVCCCKIWKN